MVTFDPTSTFAVSSERVTLPPAYPISITVPSSDGVALGDGVVVALCVAVVAVAAGADALGAATVESSDSAQPASVRASAAASATPVQVRVMISLGRWWSFMVAGTTTGRAPAFLRPARTGGRPARRKLVRDRPYRPAPPVVGRAEDY